MKHLLLLFGLLAATAAMAQPKKVLFVMSAARELPLGKGKTYTETGVFLSEFYLAWKALADSGYVLHIATPNGLVATIDKESYKPKYWKGKTYLIEEGGRFVQQDERFLHPMTLEQALARTDDYAGIVVPGGQGLMVDLVRDTLMTRLLQRFAADGRCIGLICHAPALLLSLPKDAHPFKGYRVNSVTATEEWFIERFIMKGKPALRKIGKRLREHGLVYTKRGPARNFAVRDRNLVSSQNPYSNEAFNRAFGAALRETLLLRP